MQATIVSYVLARGFAAIADRNMALLNLRWYENPGPAQSTQR
jgi:hypothetical protein